MVKVGKNKAKNSLKIKPALLPLPTRSEVIGLPPPNFPRSEAANRPRDSENEVQILKISVFTSMSEFIRENLVDKSTSTDDLPRGGVEILPGSDSPHYEEEEDNYPLAEFSKMSTDSEARDAAFRFRRGQDDSISGESSMPKSSTFNFNFRQLNFEETREKIEPPQPIGRGRGLFRGSIGRGTHILETLSSTESSLGLPRPGRQFTTQSGITGLSTTNSMTKK